ncbi:MAG TPA: ORF6N domain-containing protein [Chitinophagaceae bacterium]|nr:ORF6N domain-containing protein [Chitinophagaceae bacterium]
MPKANKNIRTLLPDEVIITKIYLIRNQKVMLDRDLADMYGVETRVLKQAVKRNITRFPKDFMFEMDKKELENWRSQFVTSNSDKMGIRYAPFCFTEQGVSMLSSVLNSEIAIQVNIQIIRIFTKMKEMLLTQKDILLKIEKLEKDVKENKQDIAMIFEALKQLLNPPQPKRRMIGFKPIDND